MKKISPAKTLNVLVTAGPTREYVDPVRFISNASSGITGYEISKAASRGGARVRLVSGPVRIEPYGNISVYCVETAIQMKNIVNRLIVNADIFISAAAVCDWRPEGFAKRKIKKSKRVFRLNLIRNPDILKEAGEKYSSTKTIVGFALETDRAMKNARKKLFEKKLDFIVINTPENIGSETAGGIIIFRSGAIRKIKRCKKTEFAKIIWEETKKISDAKRKR